MKKNKLFTRLGYWLLIWAICGTCIYFAFRDINWNDFLFHLSKTKSQFIYLGFMISAFSMFLRALRWKIQLSTCTKNVSVQDAFWAVSAGYFLNNFIPGRAGDVFRSLVVAKTYKISKTLTLSTTATEKIIDLIVLMLMCSMATFFLAKVPAWVSHMYCLGLALVGIIILFLIVIRFQNFWFKQLKRFTFLHAYQDKIKDFFQKIMMAVRSFLNFKFTLFFFCFSFIIWFSDSLAALSIAQALSLPMNLIYIFVLFTALGFASAIPSTPGYIGIYQMVAIAVLLPFNFSKEQALIFILLFQGIFYLVSILLGGMAFIKYLLIKNPSPGN